MSEKQIFVALNQGLWSDHHAIGLELLLQHQNAGDNVRALICPGELRGCAANPQHKILRCSACILQSNWSLSRVGLKEKNKSLIRFTEPAEVTSVLSFEELSSWHYKGRNLGQLVLSQLADEAGTLDERAFDPVKAKHLMVTAASLYNFGLGIFEGLDCRDTLYVWNGRRGSDGPLGYAAQDLGLQTKFFISGPNPKKYLLLDGPVDNLDSWRASIRRFPPETSINSQSASKYFAQMRYGGRESVDFQWFGEKFSTEHPKVKQRKDKPQVVLYTSTPSEYLSSKENRELPLDVRTTHQFLRSLKSSTWFTEQFDLIVRWHPNLQNSSLLEKSEVERTIKLTSDVFSHVGPESTVNSYLLLESSNLVLTMGSTMGIEAIWYGKPAILIGNAIWDELPSVRKVTSVSALIDLLRKDPFRKSSKRDAALFGSWAENHGEAFVFLTYNSEERQYFYRGRTISPVTNLVRTIGVK